MPKLHSFIRTVLLGSVLAGLVASGSAQAAEEQAEKSLYDRLSGIYPISVVVENSSICCS